MMEKRAYLDFETANYKGVACQIGLVSKDVEFESMLAVPDSDWMTFNIDFMFGEEGAGFEEYRASRSTLPDLKSVLSDHSETLYGHTIYAWNAPTERKVLAIGGMSVEVVCLLKHARSIYGKQDAGFYKLGNFAKMLGIEVEDSLLHGAGYDALLTMKVHDELDRISNG